MNYAAMEEEIDRYYADTLDTSDWERTLHEESARHPEWSVFRKKSMGYAFMAERCPVKIFRNFPYYYLVNTGRHRRELGSDGLGAWLKREPFGQGLLQSSRENVEVFSRLNLCTMWTVTDDNHHSLGYDNVFRYGLGGLRRRARQAMDGAKNAEEIDFLQAVCDGCDALRLLARRMAGQAEELLRDERDPEVRRSLARIARTAPRVPEHPPEDLYEAINTILFCFHTFNSIETNGVSTYGHIDRLLYPYYRRDIESGRLTREEARELIGSFLLLQDALFGFRQIKGGHVGSNCTVFVGGCDREGVPVFNELTEMIFDLYEELRLVDPKLNIRMSSVHPDRFFRRVSDYILSGRNNTSIFNDDVLIPACVSAGRQLEDCRTYVGGGCQENVLANCEDNSRATIYLNLAEVLLMGFFPERFRELDERFALGVQSYAGAGTFEAFYEIFLDQFNRVCAMIAAERTRTERDAVRYNPSPILSATIEDCIAKRRDISDGGARYNFGSVGQVGIGELIDSLLAVKTAVYDKAIVSLSELTEKMRNDFRDDPALRSFLQNRVEKFGSEQPDVRAFSARVFADIARLSSGFPNSRGGRYEASLFSHTLNMFSGHRTGATPSGRPAGRQLSAGMGPSAASFGGDCGLTQILGALKPLDMTAYPVVSMLELKLPAGRISAESVLPLVRMFIAFGGSGLQVNYVDQQTLEEARRDPSLHPDLVVRVSGYSSYFSVLSDEIKDDIINRGRAM